MKRVKVIMLTHDATMRRLKRKPFSLDFHINKIFCGARASKPMDTDGAMTHGQAHPYEKRMDTRRTMVPKTFTLPTFQFKKHEKNRTANEPQLMFKEYFPNKSGYHAVACLIESREKAPFSTSNLANSTCPSFKAITSAVCP